LKQEEIKDEKGTENVVAYHLSKLTIDLTSNITPIDDYFLDESSLSIASIPWSANVTAQLLQAQNNSNFFFFFVLDTHRVGNRRTCSLHIIII
jgi:hypothetical protein